MHILAQAALLLTLPSLVVPLCPDGCSCLPGYSQVTCTDGAVSQIPTVSSQTRDLDLSNSRMSSPVLRKENFTSLIHLRKLNLRGCGLNLIEYHAFTEMTTLESLDLSFNNFNIIPAGALTGLQLTDLFIENNINLRLTDTSFVGMATQILSLKKSSLTEVRPSIFTPLLGTLRKLFLEENKIERFAPGMLQVFQTVQIVRIYGNPLICDCESRWLKEFYDLNKDTTKVRDPSQGNNQEPRCVAPTQVTGRFFNELEAADFACDKPTLDANVSFSKEKGVLSCTSRGNPMPTVSWHRPNGVVVHSQAHGNMPANANENKIEIFASEPDVQGQYRCVASNDGGNVSLSVNVEWPFQSSGGDKSGDVNCNTAIAATTSSEIEVPSGNTDTQTDVFKIKYFTLVDIVGAILGTFVCTLIVTILTLHFCVYRRKTASQYATPPMSEYSSSSNSSGADKNGYQIGLHSLHTSHMHSQRPLPSKPYTHKMYDENHYMATNIEERDEFLRLPSNGRITPASSCDTTCLACRTMPHPSNVS